MFEKQTQFSIIVPVYNVKDYLGECLNSLLAQTFDSFDIIVIDDLSTDGSKDIVKKYIQRYPEKIHMVEHDVNKGLGGARNTGIDNATGKYLLFVDSDDYLKPNTLKKIDNIIQQQSADMVEFCFERVDETGAYLRRSYCQTNILSNCSEQRPLLCGTVNACNKAIRRDLFIDYKIRFPEKRYYEDYWTIPKLLMHVQKIALLDEALYCYRQRSTSIMHDTNIDKTNDIMLGTDGLLEYYHKGIFPETQLYGLERLAVEHVLLEGTLRVNGIDPHCSMQKTLRLYMQHRFPNYTNNPYLYLFSRKQKHLLDLIKGEHFFILYLCYHCRNYITGSIKVLLRKALGEQAVRRMN